MIKYLFTVGIAGLAFGQTSVNPPIASPVSNPTETPPKCLHRHQHPPQDGPIQPKINGSPNSPTIRPYPPPNVNGPSNQDSNQVNSKGDTKPPFEEATLKAAETLLNTQWQSYLQTSGVKNSTISAPPAFAWLKYQESNNLTNSQTVPVPFFQKWQTDATKMPHDLSNHQRPVGSDGKPIPFCDEIQTPGASS